MRVSVVVATYNSGRYLLPQVESILAQTQPVDEIVVTDDGSRDGTLDAVRAALRSHPDVTVLAHETNVGITGNYDRGLRAVTGDLVLLSDHDDVWRPDKAARLTAVFSELPETLMAFSDASLIDGSGAALAGSLWERVGFTAELQAALAGGRPLDVLGKKTVVTGAAAAVRSALLQRALPLPPVGWHDGWLALVAAVTSPQSLVAVPDRLLDYRLHGQNAAGVPDGSLSARWAYRHHGVGDTQIELAQWTSLRDRFPEGDEQRIVDAKLAHLRARAVLPAARLHRVGPVLAQVRRGGYRRFADGLRTAGSDLIRPAGAGG